MNEKRDEHIRKLAGALILLFDLGLLALANLGLIWPKLFYRPLITEFNSREYHAWIAHYRRFRWIPGPAFERGPDLTKSEVDVLRARGLWVDQYSPGPTVFK